MGFVIGNWCGWWLNCVIVVGNFDYIFFILRWWLNCWMCLGVCEVYCWCVGRKFFVESLWDYGWCDLWYCWYCYCLGIFLYYWFNDCLSFRCDFFRGGCYDFICYFVWGGYCFVVVSYLVFFVRWNCLGFFFGDLGYFCGDCGKCY